MTRRTCGATAALLFLFLTGPASAQQYYLYSPQSAESADAARAGEGVVVRDVPVHKGDTLSGISRKFSGHGSYYPQILLFNNIKNPDLIFAGDTLKVPVGKGGHVQQESKAPVHSAKQKKQAAAPPAAAKPAVAAKKGAAPSGRQPVSELSLSDLKQTESRKKKRAAEPPRKTKTETAPVQRSEPAAVAQPGPVQQEPASSAQRLFERALKAYRQDDCRTALELFDRFLADNASSPLAADASLYKAECYLKLSRQ